MGDRILILDVGPSPLLSNLCEKIRLEETFNEFIDWDRDRCSLTRYPHQSHDYQHN